MKNLFLLAILMTAFTTITFASNGTPTDKNVEPIKTEEVAVAKYTVYGKNNGSTVTTTIDPDGGSTVKVDIDCDNTDPSVCYTVETNAGLTEVDPKDGNKVKGILISANQSQHIYKLLQNQ